MSRRSSSDGSVEASANAADLKGRVGVPSLCVAPDFKDWIESFGIPCTALGPNLKQYTNRRSSGESKEPTRAQWKEMLRHVVREQFAKTTDAARLRFDCRCGRLADGGSFDRRGQQDPLRLRGVLSRNVPVTRTPAAGAPFRDDRGQLGPIGQVPHAVERPFLRRN
jgi:hypothetical protein